MMLCDFTKCYMFRNCQILAFQSEMKDTYRTVNCLNFCSTGRGGEELRESMMI